MKLNFSPSFTLLILFLSLFALRCEAFGLEFLVGAINAAGSMGTRSLTAEEKMLRLTDFPSAERVSKEEEEAKVKERWILAKEKGGFVEIEQGRNDKDRYSYTRYANLSSAEKNEFGFTEYWLILSTLYDEKPPKSSADRKFISCNNKTAVSQGVLFIDGEKGEGVVTKSYTYYRNPLVYKGIEAEKSALYRAVCLSEARQTDVSEPAQGKPK
ncbi:MAG: hypothetical protein V4623_00910 [Pseudomonadota bacterium]